MSKEAICETCPAFNSWPEKTDGHCRAKVPILRDGWPTVNPTNWCLAHPDRRESWNPPQVRVAEPEEIDLPAGLPVSEANRLYRDFFWVLAYFVTDPQHKTDSAIAKHTRSLVAKAMAQMPSESD